MVGEKGLERRERPLRTQALETNKESGILGTSVRKVPDVFGDGKARPIMTKKKKKKHRGTFRGGLAASFVSLSSFVHVHMYHNFALICKDSMWKRCLHRATNVQLSTHHTQ